MICLVVCKLNDEEQEEGNVMDLLIQRIKESSEPHEYRRKGSLIRRKLAEYVPVMILTNLSILLISTVDQIVAGNFIGKAAMSSISIFYPLSIVIGVFSGPVASGIATAISSAQGENDADGIRHAQSVGKHIMITVAIAISIIQIPLVLFLISTYGLSAEVSHMVREYSIGMMICTPLGIVSTVGVYVLQIAGKMKILMVLSLVEGISNVAFDLLFVAVMDMGVAGAGFGTACANLVRAIFTVIYMAKHTTFFKSDGKRVTLRDYRAILTLSLPDAAFMLMAAFQNYFTMRVVLHAFGDEGGVIFGLCAFCLSVINVVLMSIQGSMRPLMGLFVGGGDLQGIRQLVRQGMTRVWIGSGLYTAMVILIPSFFYHLHGISEIPEGGILAVQLYSLMFAVRGFNMVFRLYFTNQKDIKFATFLTIVGCATLPLFAVLILMMHVPSAYIFCAYPVTEFVILGPSILRYKYLRKKNRQDSEGDIVMYMTVKKGEAAEASEYVKTFADKHGIDERLSYKVALCTEEMVAFVEASEKFSPIPRRYLYADIVIRFKDENNAIFISIDDGAFLDFNLREEAQDLITDNYELIRKIAKSVTYQYVLDMNYTIIKL